MQKLSDITTQTLIYRGYILYVLCMGSCSITAVFDLLFRKPRWDVCLSPITSFLLARVTRQAASYPVDRLTNLKRFDNEV